MSEKGWENVFLSHKNEKFRKDRFVYKILILHLFLVKIKRLSILGLHWN